MMMMQVRKAVLLLLLAVKPVSAQFKCTFSGSKDSKSCTAVTDDSAEHCVWCSLGNNEEDKSAAREMLEAFGFCVTESQAEAMEQSIPNIHCDRYHGDSDDDDATPDTDDDATPDTDDDDNISPNDDALPDNYWTCLWKHDSTACSAANCTWCDTKGGFGLCMTGPTAESAAKSDWFTCQTTDEEQHEDKEDTQDSWMNVLIPKSIRGPLDSSCVAAEAATEKECVSTHDQDGNACLWCSALAGLTNVCLTPQQAEMSAGLGVTCDTDTDTTDANNNIKDPLDPSCLLAYLKDSSKDGCVNAVDTNGAACEFCSLQGTALEMCLNADQAAYMEQTLGLSCDDDNDNEKDTEEEEEEDVLQDPYDPSCLLAYLQDSTKDACVAAVDSDGNPCEFCTLQGSLQMCLNAEQAQMGEQIGIKCDGEDQEQEDENEDDMLQDPYDPSCLLAYLQDSTKDACIAAVDSDGNPCEFCTLQGSLQMCLNAEQAEMGEQIGIECEKDEPQEEEDAIINEPNPYDPSCVLAFLEDNMSKDACTTAVDADGNACEYCTLQGGALNLCLTHQQAETSQKILGLTCNNDDAKENVDLPPDFFDCLAHYQDDDCRNSQCTWCNTQVGMGFCLPTAAADATKECTFFDCEFDNEVNDEKAEVVSDIYDPVCLTAGMSSPDHAGTCAETTGSDGSPCVWCDAAGVFGLCLSSEQANAAGQYLQCKVADIPVATE